MQNNFKDTGIPKTVTSAHSEGAGLVISAPTAGHIIIVDILASAATKLTTASGAGSTIAWAPAGPSNLSAPIRVPVTSAVYSSAGNITINYYVERKN